MRKKLLVGLGGAFLLVVILALASAQVDRVDPTNAKIVQKSKLLYSAKFVCGNMPGVAITPGNTMGPVVSGTYRTAINVHNIQNRPVKLAKKAVIALPELRLDAGEETKPTIIRSFKLPPDGAVEIDCDDIRNLHLASGLPWPGFAKGFVTIYSTQKLDVVGVYTMENTRRFNKVLICVEPDSTGTNIPPCTKTLEVVLPAPPDGTLMDLQDKIGGILPPNADGVIPPFIIKDVSLGVGEGVSMDVEVIRPHRVPAITLVPVPVPTNTQP